MVGEIFNRKTEEYTKIMLPSGVYPIFTDDMDEMCTCPSCGDNFKFGDMYTSRKYYRVGGIFAYYVCRDCYEKEWSDV